MNSIHHSIYKRLFCLLAGFVIVLAMVSMGYGATVSITANDANAGEDGDQGQFTVSIDQTRSSDTVVSFTVSGTATEGTDYSSIGTSVTIPANSSSVSFSVTVVDDTLVEGNETVKVTLQSTDQGDTVSTTPATVTIADNDTAIVSIAANDAAAAEAGPDVGQFTVTQNAVSSIDTVISYTVSGTATGGGTDYTSLSGTVTVPSGSTTAIIDVTGIVDDNIVEGDETVIVTLTGTDNTLISVASAPSDSATVTIADNDTAIVSIAANDAAAAEAGPDVGQFTVTQNAVSSIDTVISYTVSGTATGGGTDYTSLSGTVTVPSGSTTAIIDVTGIVDDNIVEGDETVIVTLTGTDNTLISVDSAPSNSATVTIADDDNYSINITAPATTTIAENGGTLSYTVSLSNPVAAAVAVDYAITGIDSGDISEALTGTLSFAAGETSKDITLTPLADNIVEADEDFTVTVNYFQSTLSPTNSSDSATGTITDNDMATVTIEDVSALENGTMQFTVSVDKIVVGGFSLDLHFTDVTAIGGGTDYDSSTQSVTFSGTSQSQIVTVPLVNDGDVESAETFTVSMEALSPPTGVAANRIDITDKATGTILNDDHKITLTTDQYGKLTGAGGTADGSTGPATADVVVAHNSQPEFTLETTDTCYHIDDVLVNNVSQGGVTSYTFPPVTTEDQTIELKTTINQYEISTHVLGEHGTLSAGSTVDCGSSGHTFTATADSGYHITWLKVYDENNNVIQDITAANGQETYDVTINNVTEARVVEAAFTQKIEVKEVSPFGTISPDGGTEKPALVEVDYDATQSFQIDAIDPCPDGLTHNGHQHHISDILVDNSSIGGVKGENKTNYTYDFTSVEENHIIEALFTSYVDVSITGPGTVESGSFTLNNASTGLVEDSAEVESGDDAAFTIAPATGYHVAKMEIDGVVTGYASSWTFPEVVDEDHTLKVWFETDTYTLEPVSNFQTIFTDAALTTQAEAVGVEYNQNHTFYVKLTEPNNYDYTITVAGLLVDNIQYDIPTATGTVVSKPDTNPYFTMERKTINNPTDADYKEYLEITFTNVKASHRLEVLDYDKTPLADVPLDTRIRPQPATIMFVLDDSGSMDWEFMTEEGGGLFDWNYYLYNISDKLYDGHVLDQEERKQWKSQWSGHNKMYYNPQVTYTPWPTFFGSHLEDADGDTSDHVANANLDTPRSHPWYENITLDMNDTWIDFTEYTTVYSDEHVRSFANAGDHYTESITIDHDHSRLRLWTTYTGDNTDTMARVLDSGGNEYRWQEYGDLEEWDGGHYDDDSGSNWNASIDLEDVPAGTYTLDITSYHENSDGDFTLHVEVLEPQDGGQTHSIINAHYFAKDNDDNLYLVNITNPVEYYTVTYDPDADAREVIDDANLTRITDLSTVPEEVTFYSPTNYQTTPTTDDLDEVYRQERQNFVNWFSYYRKRSLSAVAAVATFIKRVENVKIGFNSINHELVHAPEPVDVVENMQIQNERKVLLTALYTMPRVAHGTPLRRGLDDVGHFYDAKNDGNNNGGIGDSPFIDGEDGSECKQVFSIVMTDGYWNGGDPAGIGDEDSDDWSPTLADVAMHYYEMDMSTLPDKVPDEGNSGQHMVTYTVGFGVKGHLDPAVDQQPAMDSHDWYAGNNDEDRIDDLWHAAVNGRGKFFSASRPDKLVASLLYIMEDIMGGRVGSGASVAINGDELFETIGDDIRIFQSSYDSDYWTGDVRAFTFDIDGEGNFTGNRTQEWSAQARLASVMNADGSNNGTARKIVTWNPGSVDGSSGVWTGKDGIPLSYSSLTGEQKNYLIDYFRGTAACSALSSYTNAGDMLLSYLRGDRRPLVCGYRQRLKTQTSFNHDSQEIIHDNDNLEVAWLGDFVNAKPIYTDGVVYAGSNDGMLHAFKIDVNVTDGSNGRELFAYMPNLVFNHVRELADPAYSHKFFVDGTPVTKKIKTGTDQYEYYLVGGLGKGGKGYYCLNITNAKNVTSEAEAAALVQWEYPPPVPDNKILSGANRFTFTSGIGTNGDDRISDSSSGFGAFSAGDFITIIGTNDHTREITNDGSYKVTAVASDGSWLDIGAGSLITGCGNLQDIIIRKSISDSGMGYTYGKPIIAETNAKSGDPAHGHVVIVANGYDSENGTASLKIINLTTGELIKTIETGRGPFNGLSTPKAVDVNNDLKVDYVYGGDLLGNMWKFDLTSDDSDDWQVAFCDNPDGDHCKNIDGTNLAEPLFSTSGHQPITGAPDIMRHKDYYGYMVIFGTGRYLGMTDLDNTDIQSVYGIWDWAPDNWDKGYLGTRIDNVLTDPPVAELSNMTFADVGGNKINTLLRQEIWCEGVLTVNGEERGYFRAPSNYKGDWSTKASTALTPSHPFYSKDINGDGDINAKDQVPVANVGWYFDLPGKISSNPAFSCSHPANVQRDLGERVTADTVIRDGKAITVSFMKEGDRCSGGLYSFINERDADNGGMPYKAVMDINGDNVINEDDLLELSHDLDGDGTTDTFTGVLTDNGRSGHLYGPVILGDQNGEFETKYFSSSTEKIEKVRETSERRGVYFWQQVE